MIEKIVKIIKFTALENYTLYSISTMATIGGMYNTSFDDI